MPWKIVWKRDPTSIRLWVNDHFVGRALNLFKDGWCAETERGDSYAPGATEELVVAWLKDMARKSAALGEIPTRRWICQECGYVFWSYPSGARRCPKPSCHGPVREEPWEGK